MNDLHIWLLDPSGFADRTAAVDMLSPDERDRAARYMHAEDRAAHIASHSLARWSLASLAGCRPAEITFEVTSLGKPHVNSPNAARAFEFSISHTRRLVGCAVARGAQVGLDIETTRDAPLDVAEKYFAEPERAQLAASSDPHDLFFRLWTLKESVIKALGTGLSTDLDSFACTTDPPSVLAGGALQLNPDECQLWQFQSESSHCVAVCVRSRERPLLRVHQIDAAELFSKSANGQPMTAFPLPQR